MAREVEGKRAAPGVLALLSKYKYVMIVLLAGIVCLAWPSKDQQEMEDILSKMQGVGELRLMLTLDQGSSKALAQDASLNYSGAPAAPEDYSRSASTVVVSKSGSGESVVVLHETYPQFRGALVVCQGGGDPAVRLAVIEAVSALTGLGSDKISVVKWQS